MAAREYVEWMAYQAIEDAAVEHQQRHVFRRSYTTAGGGFSDETSDVNGDGNLVHDVQQRLHISKTYTNLQDSGDFNQSSLEDNDKPGVMSNVKKRLSDNFEHYSNIFHEVALPILFRKGRKDRSRSRSRSRDSRKSDHSNQSSQLSHDVRNGERMVEDDFVFVENIELHHMDGFVFSSRHEIGKGHNFVLVHLRSPSWCDKCGDFIWGISKQCLKCTNCEYTCHHKCRQLVALDCAGISPDRRNGERVSRNRTETSLSEDHSKVDDADSGYHTGSSTLQSRGQRIVNKSPGQWTLTREELRRNIEVFNNNNHGLIMSLQPDTNTFQGFIRVHMNLIRPINMSLSTRPPSIYDVIGQGEEEDDGDDDSQITSFYLPKDTTKVIHINSDTTTQEVIKTLLSKFKITDNPRKFALYEKIQERKNATMRRLEDDEMPLPLCLCWTKDGVDGLDKRKFVLQENDTGEIMWEAFSLPELENFLKILNREEEEYVEQVRDKYRMLKIHMERRLKELGPPEATLSNDKRTPVFV